MQSGLFARLVIARGRTLSAERLIDEICAGPLPRNPGHALQARISRLRSAVPVEIELMHGGYRIYPTTVQTDAARFEQLSKRGSAARDDGEYAQAAECFGDALDFRCPAAGGRRRHRRTAGMNESKTRR